MLATAESDIYNGNLGTVADTKHKLAHKEVSSIQANETTDLSRPKPSVCKQNILSTTHFDIICRDSLPGPTIFVTQTTNVIQDNMERHLYLSTALFTFLAVISRKDIQI